MAENPHGETSPLRIPPFDNGDSVGRVERSEQHARDTVRSCVESCDELTAIAAIRPFTPDEACTLGHVVCTAWQYRHEASEVVDDDGCFADEKLIRELPLLVQVQCELSRSNAFGQMACSAGI
jgi:hypothetical protein